MRKLMFAILLIAISNVVYGQKDNMGSPDTTGVEDDFKFFLDSIGAMQQRPLLADSALVRSYADYYVYSLNHRKRVFDWQYVSGIAIFWVVLAILMAGLVLSVAQFILSYKNLKVKVDTTTEMKLSATELSVKSSVLGIIILTLSIVFFYLYLTIVYPISVVQ